MFSDAYFKTGGYAVVLCSAGFTRATVCYVVLFLCVFSLFLARLSLPLQVVDWKEYDL